MKTVTQNACQLCTPLGAGLVFKGVEGCVPLLHGSQGCATYIRRYLISHFREPIDIASSSFTEETAVFGGAENLKTALDNVTAQYEPAIIGVASTCLSETIGDDLPRILRDWNESRADLPGKPKVVQVATPSYRGSHSTGFHGTVKALVEAFNPGEEAEAPSLHTSVKSETSDRQDLNLFPGMISPEDIRELKRITSDYGLKPMILPDYSETLDGEAWSEYRKIPSGGTPAEALGQAGKAALSLELSGTLTQKESAGFCLFNSRGVPTANQPRPIGIRLSDRFHRQLSELSGQPMPKETASARGRLVDAYADAHKYIFGRRAVLFGEKDMLLALAVFLEETGITPVLCGTGEGSGLKEALTENLEHPEACEILAPADFDEIEKRAAELNCDMAIGNSKGYKLSQHLKIPLIRTGFPIHDRIGSQREKTLGYNGTQVLFDRIVNAVMEEKQNASPIGYTYI